jgi:hypothetical protein
MRITDRAIRQRDAEAIHSGIENENGACVRRTCESEHRTRNNNQSAKSDQHYGHLTFS